MCPRYKAACEIADFGTLKRKTTIEQAPDAHPRPDTASGSWMVRVFSAGDAVVCAQTVGR